MVSTWWGNCSLRTDFHGSSQVYVSGHTDLFQGYELAHQITCSFSTRILPLMTWNTESGSAFKESLMKFSVLWHQCCLSFHGVLDKTERCHIQTIMLRTNSWWKWNCIYVNLSTILLTIILLQKLSGVSSTCVYFVKIGKEVFSWRTHKQGQTHY